MRWARRFMIGSRVAAFTAASWFAVRYHRVHWERTPEGKNVMAMAVSIAATAFFGTLAEVKRRPSLVVAAGFPWLSVAGVLAWRNQLRERGELAWKRDHPGDVTSQHQRRCDDDPH